jgi:fibronectin-binding autotransporter adhesin
MTPLSASTILWNGSTDALWDTPANWTPTGEPLAADDAIFPAVAPALGLNITLAAGEVANSLTFRNDYVLSAGALALSAGTVTVAPATNATIGSVLEGSGGLTLAASNLLAGVDAQIGGGRLILSGTNTYAGPTTISAGVLSISNSANLGNASATNTIAISGGTLQNTGAAVTLGTTRTVQISSNGAPAADGATFDVAANSVLTVNGLVSGTANHALTKTGAGTLVLSTAANSFIGKIVVNEGFISVGEKVANSNPNPTKNLGDVGNDILLNGGGIRWTAASSSSGVGRWTVNTGQVWEIGPNGGTIDIVNKQSAKIFFATGSNLITGSGTITKKGFGPLTIEIQNTTFTGNWVLDEGILEVRGTAALGDGTNLITVNNGELANAVGSGITTIANAITMNGGAIAGQSANTPIYSGPITFNNSSTVRVGDWWQNVARDLNFTGVLTGAGAINVSKGSFGTGTYITGGSEATTVNTGTLFIKNAANTLSGPVTIQNNIKVNTASATNSGSTIGTADFTLAGGTLQLRDDGLGNNDVLDYTSNDLTVAANAGSGVTVGIATLDVNRASANSGNTFQLGKLSIGAEQFNVTGGNGYVAEFTDTTTLTGTPTLNVDTADLVLSGGVSGGANGITKSGAGKLTLGGLAAFTGATNVNAGKLAVEALMGGAVNVASGAQVEGTGAISGALTIASGGTLAPGGVTPGNMLAGSLALNGGTLALDLESTIAYDGMSVDGVVALNAPVTLTLALATTFAAGSEFAIILNNSGQAVTLADAASRFVFNGTPLNEGDNFTATGGFGSQEFELSYAGGDGNDVVLTAVPEPGSAVLLVASLGLLARARRRRQS